MAETLDPIDLEDVATIAKALAHPARVQILKTLMEKRSCIGCDLSDEVGLAASTTSEHLRILKAAGLIEGEIQHPRVCYSLKPQGLSALIDFLSHLAATPMDQRPRT
ncbi:ArsR/SmtB family transcription factor [Woodsholea maritima]|uniref:ArsR/SmtB family transcription factor n=1 Tax=Woodsholea maritima TaxID=240237 RepID=UPI000364990F|nr:metalloregulator ArsR/SmtB family transcription factor [Woodsholea maritima]